MTTSISRRIAKEWQMINQEVPEGIIVEPVNNDLSNINIWITNAPPPYDGGVFHVRMLLTSEYPMVPPKVFFNTKIFHPNISQTGEICLDILKNKWSPAMQIVKIAISIVALLGDPNLDDPLNNNACAIWKEDINKAYEIARKWTKEYAVKKNDISNSNV